MRTKITVRKPGIRNAITRFFSGKRYVLRAEDQGGKECWMIYRQLPFLGELFLERHNNPKSGYKRLCELEGVTL